MANKDYDRSLELQYFDRWRDTGKKEYFQKLYHIYGGLIHKASRKAAVGSNIPESVFKLQAAQQFHDSLRTFDPSRGAALPTHIFNGVNNKLKRINAQYGNLARIPERSGTSLGIFHINQLKNSEELLRQKLNRDPTIGEIAKDMSVTPDQVEGLQKEIRKDLSLNAELEDLTAFDEFAGDKDILNMVYYDMNHEQQLLYDYLNGEHGKTQIMKPSGQPDYKAIAKKIGIPEARVQKIRKQIRKMIVDIGL